MSTWRQVRNFANQKFRLTPHPESKILKQESESEKKISHALSQRGPTKGPRATCGPQTEFLRPASPLSIDYFIHVTARNFN